MSKSLELSPNERLTLHQLRLVEWAEGRSQVHSSGSEDVQSARVPIDSIPNSWVLTREIQLAPWQQSARDSWFTGGKRGTIKVVTGVGKTIVALAIAERLQHEDPDLRVAIVVPTIVLMNQWIDTLVHRSNLPASALARVGGGYSDDFDETKRVMVAVLASARKELPATVRKHGLGNNLLLIADECHRAGAPEMSAVLQTPRQYSLGLSATPERSDVEEGGGFIEYQTSKLGTQIGPIVYGMTFAEATHLGVLPPFEIHHLGLSLSPTEANRYEALSRSISDARRELMASSPSARKFGGDQLLPWARRVSRGQSDLAQLAYGFLSDTSRRKFLLYQAESRVAATRALVGRALKERADSRVILFHESIPEVIALYGILRDDGFPVVMEHSELSSTLREQTLDLFRTGTAKVIVSARSLIEGFNVPEADLGIIVASSSSPRQRIQSIGRVLRTYRSRTGEEKSSRVYVLYIRDSVDEQIYEKEDWDELVGLDRNRYFRWEPPEDPVELPDQPRSAVPRETDIDLNSLSLGDTYPGRYEGTEFSADSQGNVTDTDGRVAVNPQGIPEVIQRLKGRLGRFRATARSYAILVRVQTDTDSWTTLYGGTLSEPFDFGTESASPANFQVGNLTVGEPYPGPIHPSEEYWFRQRRGGVIGKRIRGGEAFAHGEAADRLVSVLREIRRAQSSVSKIYVNQLNHVFWRENGLPRFIAALESKLEFPADT